jgi:hypothetical protein
MCGTNLDRLPANAQVGLLYPICAGHLKPFFMSNEFARKKSADRQNIGRGVFVLTFNPLKRLELSKNGSWTHLRF